MSVAYAVAALAVSILAWPLKFLIHHRALYPMAPGGAAYPMAHHGGASLWHLGLLLVFVLWAGIAGAIIAAVYNAMIAKR